MNRDECLAIISQARERGLVPDLTRANLSGANLSGANLSGANLSGADLSGANLTRANLSYSNLRGADLSGANLRGADLTRADLTRANLTRANLRGADLDFASLPLWCGGTQMVVDRHLSLQLIYHAFNQSHSDPDIRLALEPLRPLAEEFRQIHHSDAPALWVRE